MPYTKKLTITRSEFARKENIRIQKGTDWELEVTFLDEQGNAINLTGFTGKAQARTDYATTGTKICDFTVDITTPASGKFKVSLSNANSDSTAITTASGIYDVELTDTAGKVERVLEGSVTFLGEVTV